MNQQKQDDFLVAYGLINQANGCFAKEDYSGALNLCAQVLELMPDHFDAIKLAGMVKLKQDDIQHAQSLLLLAYQKSPKDFDVCLNLANVFCVKGENLTLAIQLLQECIVQKPKELFLYMALAEAALQAEDFDIAANALSVMGKGADQLPLHFLTLLMKFRDAEKHELIKRILEPMIHRFSGNREMNQILLMTYDDLDETENTIRLSEQIIDQFPESYPGPYVMLARLKTKAMTHREAEILIKMLPNKDMVGDEEVRFSVLNAIATIYDALGEYDESFKYQSMANDIRFKAKQETSRRRYENLVGKAHSITQQYADSLSQRDPCDSGVELGKEAVFVISMPRSGSTLTEQILGSHGQITPVGENSAFHMQLLPFVRDAETDVYELMGTWEKHQFDELGRAYLKAIHDNHHPEGIFVDKMPFNFPLVGAIMQALPGAKIIHAKRHPLGTCLGCFQTPLQIKSGANDFSYDLETMGQYYKSYAHLMNFWEEKFPDRIHSVYYEDVVDDIETETRAMLDFLGLPMDDSCLRFYENKRKIKTASKHQANKPIMKDRTERWKNYEKHLQPVYDIIRDEVDSYSPKCQRKLDE